MSFSWRFTLICLLLIPWPIPLAFQVTLQPHQCRCCSHFFRLSSCLTLVFLCWSDEGRSDKHPLNNPVRLLLLLKMVMVMMILMMTMMTMMTYIMMIVFWWWQWRLWQYDDWQLTQTSELFAKQGAGNWTSQVAAHGLPYCFCCLLQRVLRCWYKKIDEDSL